MSSCPCGTHLFHHSPLNTHSTVNWHPAHFDSTHSDCSQLLGREFFIKFTHSSHPWFWNLAVLTIKNPFRLIIGSLHYQYQPSTLPFHELDLIWIFHIMQKTWPPLLLTIKICHILTSSIKLRYKWPDGLHTCVVSRPFYPLTHCYPKPQLCWAISS